MADKEKPTQSGTPPTEDAFGSQYVVIGGPERKAERTNIIVMKFKERRLASATTSSRILAVGLPVFVPS